MEHIEDEVQPGSADATYSTVLTICDLLDTDAVTGLDELAALAAHLPTIWKSELAVSCREQERRIWSGHPPPSLTVGASPAVLWWHIRNRHHLQAMQLLDEQMYMVAVVRQLVAGLPRTSRGLACPLAFVHFRCVFSVECLETIVERREIAAYLPKLLHTGHFEALIAASTVVPHWRTDTHARLLRCLQQWLEPCRVADAVQSEHLALLQAALAVLDRHARYDSAAVMQPWKDLRSELGRLQSAACPRPSAAAAVGKQQHIKRDWKISVAQAVAAASGATSPVGLPPLSPRSPTLSPTSPLALVRHSSAP
jgi:hypothetical protein